MAAVLHWVDYLIFVAFLLASLGIGVFHSLGGKQKTTQEFIMADRKLPVLPTMLSLLASYQSAIMILGSTAEMYNWGIQAWVIGVISTVLSIFLTERIIVPWIYPLKLTSTYEYFAMRFQSRAVAMLGAAIGILKANLYMGIAIYAPSIALEAACGFPAYASIPLMSLLCTVYTALGGMKAVIWTDVFQFLVMLAGMLTILIKGNIVVGGFGKALEMAGQEGRLNYINFSWDFTRRHTFWAFFIGSVPAWSMIYGLQQASVQRYSATKSLRDARLTLLFNMPTTLLMGAIANMTGLTVLAYFAWLQCDPKANGDVTTSNQILTHFVNIVFKNATGFAGLFLATLYSGALSSVSSSLSGSAANMWECILRFILPPMKDSQATLLNKALVVMFGVIATGLAFLASGMPGPVSQVASTFGGAAGGPLLGIFLLGGAFPFVEWKGAIAGGISGLIVNFWVGIGSRTIPSVNIPMPPVSTEGCSLPFNYSSVANSTAYLYTTLANVVNVTEHTPFRPQGIQKLYAISYLWYSPLGCLVCVVVGITVSLASRFVQSEKPAPVPKRLLIPWGAALTCGNYTRPDDKAKLEVDYHLAGSKVKDVVSKDVPEEYSTEKNKNNFCSL